MKKIREFIHYFTLQERILWGISVIGICVAQYLSGGNVWGMVASIIGSTAILFNAKGNSFGQMLMIVFAMSYGVVSFSCRYYGEMITYLCMTLPMATISLISWLRHPFNGNKTEVEVSARLKKAEIIFMFVLTLVVTVIFYFILKALNTNRLIVSTFSVTTSFLAVYLNFRRSPYFSLSYACNDIVLIVLWIYASIKDPKYVSQIICFTSFLAVDTYSFINWQRMRKKQALIKAQNNIRK